MNLKKCTNIAKIITKTINNFLSSDLAINNRTFDLLVDSMETNLNFFYDHEKIKVGKYKEKVKIVA